MVSCASLKTLMKFSSVRWRVSSASMSPKAMMDTTFSSVSRSASRICMRGGSACDCQATVQPLTMQRPGMALHGCGMSLPSCSWQLHGLSGRCCVIGRARNLSPFPGQAAAPQQQTLPANGLPRSVVPACTAAGAVHPATHNVVDVNAMQHAPVDARPPRLELEGREGGSCCERLVAHGAPIQRVKVGLHRGAAQACSPAPRRRHCEFFCPPAAQAETCLVKPCPHPTSVRCNSQARCFPNG